ncbi:bifunctional glutamate N-acetyltransferase/amino-acid acetyltransferase ArgJ [Congregibacter litoralis]|uniref:bifunctional glutamate N-acetyltransferase/amino-acid acetyltransferase ArgJ n=1 Tax=Congregibacter litoralis TaxID=393662 RepID=UPI00006B9E29|nr:bifunctional glutamate N-acetyltransferase/amino-acid acetyltransferase ArgJ [Congregibacter litoralis]
MALPVPGVTVSAVEAGIRYADRLDLVALKFDQGTTAAAVFTRNAFCAAPVIVAREHLAACDSMPRLLLINTGNANAGTGAPGIAAARRSCEEAATLLGLSAHEVLPFSTGVIGEDLPLAPLVSALPTLFSALSPEHWLRAAHGIMTTDTRPKAGSRRFAANGRDYVLTGIAKGAGMLRPDMATMLAFLTTDAPIAPSVLDHLLRRAVEMSFHRITVDGDTSTNDAVLLAATGAGDGEVCEDPESELGRALGEALEALCLELAQGLVRDGEGASKFVEVDVRGGADERECLDVAFTIAHSPLVKTALFAGDPNWGRLLAAIGRAGLRDLDVNGVRILINDALIAEKGSRATSYDESEVAAFMQQSDLRVIVELGRGQADARVWTSDFSYDYVKINAEYRS